MSRVSLVRWQLELMARKYRVFELKSKSVLILILDQIKRFSAPSEFISAVTRDSFSLIDQLIETRVMFKLSEGICNEVKAWISIMVDSVIRSVSFKTGNQGFISMNFLSLLSSDLNSSRKFRRFYFSKILKSEI